MSKAKLKDMCISAKNSHYRWQLYFFKIDRRANQPFNVHKVKFKNDSYLSGYTTSLLNATETFQIDPISKVQDYTGENSKVSCDKLPLTSELISEQWENFSHAVATSSSREIDGKINGYILCGQPQPYDHDDKPVMFVKVANPVVKLENKKSVVFSSKINNELDLISDDVYRLYLTVDFIIYDNTIYAFNYTFETVFNLERTMKKVKQQAIDVIVCTNAFTDTKIFKTFANQYPSSRTFITLNPERIDRIKNRMSRRNVAKMLNLTLDANDNFDIKNEEDAYRLIKYLCFKIFQDGETNNVLEVSSVTVLR